MSGLVVSALTAMALSLSAGAGWAQAPTSTLAKIAETGVIRLGYSAEDIPFSYRTPDGTVMGYSTDLCVRVVDHLKQQLGLAALAIEYVERTPRNRVAMLRDGALDIECVASTNNAERRKSVAFSYSHFVTGTQFVSLKKNNLRTMADLAGHTVVATSGTTNLGQLATANRERGLHIAVMPVETHKDAFKLVTEGRASAFVMDGILLAAMVASSEHPDDYMLSSDSLGWPEPYGLMVRREDTEFRDAVNTALLEIYGSGEINAIYDKWFTKPIPPDGINMRLPMSEELRRAFLNPSIPKD
ncbi:amino acid ABC transporter substrate-binding protein [Agrobacterium sp. a22-2]|uniref:amino acid ABC transporter substrate-binding protein n=1 Tax=Agrobacterium sp. a22-2 TaxID=2283840 RepID=UPI0014451C9E|nr:amino acid ABC transporter substrate-binding protein [Agrobacterium sp. a22-2]NKN38503.1 amino acid ABC transporter substrate-binding protein [Agrobacterium sp. a22-2]